MKTETLKPNVALQPRPILLSMKDDISSWMHTDHLDRDIDYLLRRYDSEGDAFICVTMPLLGRAIEDSLVQKTPLQVPMGWRLQKGSVLPHHFNVYFKHVYADNGTPLNPTANSRTAVFILRQLFLLWSKREVDTYDNEDETIKKFMERITLPRHRLWDHMVNTNETQRAAIMKAKAAMHRLFVIDSTESQRIREFLKEPWGRHGPGAVANKEEAADKWNFVKYPHLPMELFRWNDRDIVPAEAGQAPSSRVTCVPKDFRGPRIICIEPKEFQFAQQGLLSLLNQHVHDHYLTRTSINFNDVSRSQRMCFNTDNATIDLKDASDLISLQLVKFLFPRWMYKALVRYRTPTVGNARSTCFATMGSALCFPVQTIVFWALCRGCVDVYTRYNRHAKRGPIRIFGDDLIVPKSCAPFVCSVLTACGLQVNLSKTCIRSEVREACGEWVYAGVTSRIIRPKIHRIRSIEDWCAAIDVAESFKKKGYINTSRYYQTMALDVHKPVKRHCERYQRPELRVPLLVKRRAPHLEGYAALYAWRFHSNTSPFSRGTRSRVKWRWISLDSKFLD